MNLAYWLFRAAVTLGLAAFALLQAPTRFEAVAFLAALVAYHKLSWALDGAAHDERLRLMALTAFLARVDYRLPLLCHLRSGALRRKLSSMPSSRRL